MAVCSVIGCDVTEGLQEHHVSYVPEIKMLLCKEHHLNIHGHGVGGKWDFRVKRGDEHPAFSFKIPRGILSILKQFISMRTYMSTFAFIRVAVTEKLREEALHLFWI